MQYMKYLYDNLMNCQFSIECIIHKRTMQYRDK